MQQNEEENKEDPEFQNKQDEDKITLDQSMFDKNVDFEDYRTNKEEKRLVRTEWRA